MTEKKYIQSVARKLLCSKARKTEIRKELESDIRIAMEQGEPLEDILRRMGNADSVAAEFNSNFPESERRSAGRRKRLYIICSIVIIVALLFLLAVWWCPKTKEIGTSGIYHMETVVADTADVIELWDADDMEGLYQISNETMQKAITPEELADVKAQLSTDWGERQSLGQPYMAEITQMGITLVTVQINAAYEHINVTYTISFDENMELAGFYVK